MSAVTIMTEDEEDAIIEKAMEIARAKIKRQHDELEGYSDAFEDLLKVLTARRHAIRAYEAMVDRMQDEEPAP